MKCRSTIQSATNAGEESGALPIKAKTISGSIDLSASGKREADVDLSTISGRIFSDLELNPEKSKSSIPVRIHGKMNNGGVQVKLETISGDIYLRKSEL